MNDRQGRRFSFLGITLEKGIRDLNIDGDIEIRNSVYENMKLVRLVPLFVLLITIVTLMPSAHATSAINNSKSNSYRVVPPTTFTAPIAGTATISWLVGGKPANLTPTVETFAFSVPAANAKASPTQPKTVTIATAPDSADVTISSDEASKGNMSGYRCSQHVILKPNVPVTATCATGQNGAGPVITVEITNIGEQAPVG